MFILTILIIIICRIPSSTDGNILFFHKKHEKHVRFHAVQQQGSASSMPGTVGHIFNVIQK